MSATATLNRARAAFACDVRLQLRQGFYAAYAFVAVVYIVLLLALPPAARLIALPLLLLSETGVIGFMFAGAMLHLERGAGTTMSLAVTPLPGSAYVLARMLSLALVAALTAAVIAGPVLGAAAAARIAPIAAASALTAAIFCCVGIAWAARVATLEKFAVQGGAGTAVLGLPALPYFGIAESPLWYVLPTTPLLALLEATTRGAGAAWHDMLLGLIWTTVAFALARTAVERRVFGREARS
jgi:fluoroquinolone transport system permease protein